MREANLKNNPASSPSAFAAGGVTMGTVSTAYTGAGRGQATPYMDRTPSFSKTSTSVYASEWRPPQQQGRP